MEAPTVASLLPPKVRNWVYALLGLGVPALNTADAIYQLGPWVQLVTVIAVGGGFGLAVANTTVKSEPESEDEDEVYFVVDATGPEELPQVVEEDDDDDSEPVGFGVGSVLR